MNWWQFVLQELLKILPDIINLISGHANPAQAAAAFLDHVKSFKL